MLHTISYSGNGNDGGSPPVDGGSYPDGAQLYLPSQGTLTRTGYSFAGWDTDPGGNGTFLPVGGNWGIPWNSLTSNFTWYAKWWQVIAPTPTPSPQTYSIIYSGNGNSGGLPALTQSTGHVSGESVIVSGSGTLVKVVGGSTYAFSIWNTAPDGTGYNYHQGDLIILGTANITLYAQWAIVTPTSTPTSTPIPTNTPAPTSTGTPTATAIPTPTATATPAPSTTPTPTPTPSTSPPPLQYRLIYDGNGTTGGSPENSSTDTYLPGTKVKVGGAGSLVKADYTFEGWNTSSTGSGDVYLSGWYVKMGKSNVTLYAQWTHDPTPIVTITSAKFGRDGNFGAKSAHTVDGRSRLKNVHTEWALLRTRQSTPVPRELWEKLTDTLVGKTLLGQGLPSIPLSTYDLQHGTSTRYGFGSGQIITDSSIAIATVQYIILNTKIDKYVNGVLITDYISFIDQGTPFDITQLTSYFVDEATIRKFMENLWRYATPQQINEIFFAVLNDSLSSNLEITDFFKTAYISMNDIRTIKAVGN